MKKWAFFLLLTLMACSKLIDKPEDLISKDNMAAIMADFAVNDQSYMVNHKDNKEGETKFILQKYKVSAKTFNNSYTYYTATGELDNIIDRAQKVLLSKDPKLEAYIKKKEQPVTQPEKTN